MSRPLEKIIQELYNREIHFQIEWFWDDGFNIRIGDELNGFSEQASCAEAADIGAVLMRLANKHYPIS